LCVSTPGNGVNSQTIVHCQRRFGDSARELLIHVELD
jgi:hypothetical protein